MTSTHSGLVKGRTCHFNDTVIKSCKWLTNELQQQAIGASETVVLILGFLCHLFKGVWVTYLYKGEWSNPQDETSSLCLLHTFH